MRRPVAQAEIAQVVEVEMLERDQDICTAGNQTKRVTL